MGNGEWGIGNGELGIGNSTCFPQIRSGCTKSKTCFHSCFPQVGFPKKTGEVAAQAARKRARNCTGSRSARRILGVLPEDFHLVNSWKNCWET